MSSCWSTLPRNEEPSHFCLTQRRQRRGGRGREDVVGERGEEGRMVIGRRGEWRKGLKGERRKQRYSS